MISLTNIYIFSFSAIRDYHFRDFDCRHRQVKRPRLHRPVHRRAGLHHPNRPHLGRPTPPPAKVDQRLRRSGQRGRRKGFERQQGLRNGRKVECDADQRFFRRKVGQELRSLWRLPQRKRGQETGKDHLVMLKILLSPSK